MEELPRGRGALKLHNPIGLPSPPGVERKGLLPARRGCRDLGPSEACPSRLPIHAVVGVEGAHAMIKGTLDRRIERSQRIALVEPPNRPLPCVWVVRAQRYSVKDAARLVEHVLFHIGLPVHQRPVARRTLEFRPSILLAFHPMADAPLTHEEVEIVDAAWSKS